MALDSTLSTHQGIVACRLGETTLQVFNLHRQQQAHDAVSCVWHQKIRERVALSQPSRVAHHCPTLLSPVQTKATIWQDIKHLMVVRRLILIHWHMYGTVCRLISAAWLRRCLMRRTQRTRPASRRCPRVWGSHGLFHAVCLWGTIS